MLSIFSNEFLNKLFTIFFNRYVVAIYEKTSAQNVISGNVITYSGQVQDTHNTFSNGVFTAPRQGIAIITQVITTANFSASVGDFLSIEGRLNGTIVRSSPKDRCENTIGRQYTVQMSLILPMNEGDTYDSVFDETLPTTTLSTIGKDNRIEILFI